ncbi:hypothetical protein P43SY_009914 [Pythium insidiosum]|uniref:OB domain-containing protein n=1 Tax=Pythium insidiosum TaxID=114742 RepID=A0AAD5M1J9_PYTIN|nr:hypothetical protein P43SY_009914 [Pythium insidiosum]KAJ0404513.1 hypothetical protein ATCC90586_007770 [Pythium insidiosum]
MRASGIGYGGIRGALASKPGIFTLTFFSYVMFHACRKSFSAIKGEMSSEQWIHSSVYPKEQQAQMYGLLDTLFMAFYAIGLYVSGVLGDNFDLRRIISGGMWLTAIIMFMFGFGAMAHIHSLGFYATLWALNGLVQSSGWPANVAVIHKLCLKEFREALNVVINDSRSRQRHGLSSTQMEHSDPTPPEASMSSAIGEDPLTWAYAKLLGCQLVTRVGDFDGLPNSYAWRSPGRRRLLTKALFVGLLVSIQVRAERVEFQVDDGSGIVHGVLWTPAWDHSVVLGDLVLIQGKLNSSAAREDGYDAVVASFLAEGNASPSDEMLITVVQTLLLRQRELESSEQEPTALRIKFPELLDGLLREQVGYFRL